MNNLPPGYRNFDDILALEDRELDELEECVESELHGGLTVEIDGVTCCLHCGYEINGDEIG